MKKLIVIPLLSCILLLSSCGGLSELSFVTIGEQTIAANGLDPTSRIEVVTQTPSSIQGISPVDLSALQSVDYSEDVAFVVSFGYGGSTVTRISQLKALTGNSTIWVKTNIPESTKDTGFLRYQIVTVKRAQIFRRGSVLVRLLGSIHHDKGTVIFSNRY
ncbi:hypothetical protein ACFLV2_01450 [Chloroflexota bacterium]